jgi:hypothetical protein
MSSQTVKQVASAFIAGHKAHCHNAHTDGTTYWLHGSAIATHKDGMYIQGNWCGYYTTTTANHLKAIRDAMGGSMLISYSKARDAGEETFIFS